MHYGIIGDIVDEKKLRKIEITLRALHGSPSGIKPAKLVGLASRLGRVLDPRGKEPTYVRKLDPTLSPPLSIPNHKELKVGTARNVIEQLLDDVDCWRQHALTEEKTP